MKTVGHAIEIHRTVDIEYEFGNGVSRFAMGEWNTSSVGQFYEQLQDIIEMENMETERRCSKLEY